MAAVAFWWRGSRLLLVEIRMQDGACLSHALRLGHTLCYAGRVFPLLCVMGKGFTPLRGSFRRHTVSDTLLRGTVSHTLLRGTVSDALLGGTVIGAGICRSPPFPFSPGMHPEPVAQWEGERKLPFGCGEGASGHGEGGKGCPVPQEGLQSERRVLGCMLVQGRMLM